MREEFLYYVWQYQKFSSNKLLTVSGEVVKVLSVGEHNTNSGPDFYNAKLQIGDQVWVGAVEMHIKSSDWYVHQHHNDKAYKNVILHVVWEDDVVVFDASNNNMATLEVQPVVNQDVYNAYDRLLQSKTWINCESQIHLIDDFTLKFWKEKLLIKRLEDKGKKLKTQLETLGNDWEALLFYQLAKGFGLKLNSDQFLQIARSITFKVVKKELPTLENIEALLYGQANLLNEKCEDPYFVQLQKQFNYLRKKYQLKNSVVQLRFFRMRPSGFPTVRLAQLAMLYYQYGNLFMKVIELQTLKELRDLLSVCASSYWDTHYTFGKASSKRSKKLSKAFIDVLLVNVIIPIKFMFAKSQGKDNFEYLLSLYAEIPSENNSIINKFKTLKFDVSTSADSQALIELKTQFCDLHKCLQCEIGNKLLYPL
ncbi:MAG: DUF2851 family protein [Flavobacteriaceae bacterium]